MISSLFGRELGARLAGNMVPELGWTSFEFARITRPLRDALAGGLNRYYSRANSVICDNLLTDMVRANLRMDDGAFEQMGFREMSSSNILINQKEDTIKSCPGWKKERDR